MARTVKDTTLDSRTARAKLPARRKPYYRLIEQGCHLGYYKGKRGGSWTARYFLGDGRYREAKLGTADDGSDADGVAILSFAQAQAAARAWFTRQAHLAAGDEVEDAGPYTVEDAIEHYLADYRGRGGKAVDDAEKRSRSLILPALGSHQVSKLTPAKIRQWHRDLAATPPRLRTQPGEEQRYRNTSNDPEAGRRRKATANRVLTTLKAALNHAYLEGKVSRDDAWRRVKSFRDVGGARVRYLSIDECRRLANACVADFRPMVQAALYSGCRYGELARLSVADFNPDSDTLLVREAKSGKPRHVFLAETGRDFFETVAAGRRGVEPMFPRPDGDRWGRSHQVRRLAEACDRGGIYPPASFHILRHTYASLMVMNGAPLQVVAQNLGHADTRMVERHYGHLAPSYVADQIRAYAPRLDIDEKSNLATLRSTL